MVVAVTYVDGRFVCPYCKGRDTHEHSQTWWCMNCGWSQNKPTSRKFRQR